MVSFGSRPMGEYRTHEMDLPCSGCTIPSACNYDETAIEDDGSCDFTSCLYGCMDVNACNFSETAISDDGSCDYETCEGCTDALACNYDATATIDAVVVNMSMRVVFAEDLAQCMNAGAQLWIQGLASRAGEVLDQCGVCGGDDSTCVGCTYETACNYDPNAVILDVSLCEFGTCPGCTDQQP